MLRRVYSLAAFLAGVIAMAATGSGHAQPVDYLADLQHRFSSAVMGWGVLGVNTCAHQPDRTPLPLQIKDKLYARGLGMHAPGHLVVELDGEYEAFEAEVGVQWQGQNVGSVVFQVFVDGEKRFDSGVMHETDEPKHVRVSLKGAQELALVVTDAGDGIICDCANWVEARLLRAARPSPVPPAELLDAAIFARVVTCDPNRQDGARASRIEEFRAEDVFLETDLPRRRDGAYDIPANEAGTGCIGLVWMEPRRLRELGIEFAASAPQPQQAHVEYWSGETIWQGQWLPVAGHIEASGTQWILRVSREENPALSTGTRKIRWIIPAAIGLKVRKLWALSPSRLKTAEVILQLEKPRAGRAQVEVYNGLLSRGSGEFLTRCDWDLAKPLRLRVKHTPRAFLSAADRTLLLLRLPEGGFGISVQDALSGDGVFVRDYGVLASRYPAPVSPSEYRRRLAGRKSVLDIVHERPDQTFAAAMAAVHRPAQDNGPTMLSLACHNAKYIVERAGTVHFSGFSARPSFGLGRAENLRRCLDGGWLPAPVTTVEDGGLIYRQRTFVAPVDEGRPSGAPAWLREGAVCVAEFEAQNPTGQAAQAFIGLNFLADTDTGRPASMVLDGPCAEICDGDRLLAVLDATPAPQLRLQLSGDDGTLALCGALAPGDRARCALFIPSWPTSVSDHLRFRDSLSLFADFERYWRAVLAATMQVEIPDKLLADVIRASQVHCLIAARNEDDGRRIEPWIAANTYGPLESEAHSVIYGMDLMGHHDFSRRALEYFIHRYNPAGFLTTGYTIMGTGWHLWTLADHVRLADDRDWLRAHADEIARVCDWVVRQRRKTMRVDPDGQKLPEYGLMPPGVMADWNAYGYFFFFNAHFCAGLREAAEVLADVGHPRAEDFRRDAREFADEILRAYRWMQGRAPVLPLRDGTWVPSYPSVLYCPGLTAEFFPGADWGRVWANNVEIGAHHLVAAEILDPASREADWIVRYMEDAPFLADGMGEYPAAESESDPFNLGGFAKVQPYYCRIAEVYALRDDVKAFVRAYFNALPSLLNTENLSLWEHFHNMGAWNKTHETGWFLVQTHRMFVLERGQELWLAPFVAQSWMKDGNTIAVDRAPTRFGPVSYRLQSHAARGWIEAHIEPPPRATPSALVLRIRHPQGLPMRSVTVNDATWQDFDAQREIVRLPADRGSLDVRVAY